MRSWRRRADGRNILECIQSSSKSAASMLCKHLRAIKWAKHNYPRRGDINIISSGKSI